MDKELTEDQSKWQKLVEEKSFSQLSKEELAFVQKYGSQIHYQLEYQILVEMRSESGAVELRPLILPKDEKRDVVVPLYQAILAVAAAFVIGFLIMRTGQLQDLNLVGNTIASTDTLYIDRVERDTIVLTEKEIVDRIIYVRKRSDKALSPRLIQEQKGIVLKDTQEPIPVLSSMELNNGGNSALNDETFVLVENFSFSGSSN